MAYLFSILFALTLLLFVVECGYIYIARHRGLVEHRTLRSSHSSTTVAPGAGFIIPMAVWAACLAGFDAPWFILAVTIVAAVSLTDDFHPLPDWLRLIVQVGAMALVGFQLGFTSPLLWIFGILFGVAVMNAFNFMDGINGMTVFYATAVTVPLILMAHYILPGISNPIASVLPYLLPPLLVFGFFNCRKRPLAFAGDVGAVSLGLILTAALLGFLPMGASVQPSAGDFVFLLFFVLVYGVDTAMTLIIRIRKGENIRQAHRSHLFQLLVNEAGYAQLKVAALFALVQLVVDAFAIFCRIYDIVIPGFIAIAALLCADYIYLRRSILAHNS